MKFQVYLMIFLFSIFLVTPSVITFTGSDIDVASFFEAAEEEETNNPIFLGLKNNIKTEFSICCLCASVFQVKNKFYSISLSFDNFCLDVAIPPPDLGM